MSEDDTGQADGTSSDDRLRMDLYELLHGRAEAERRWQFWRLAAGHAVVGVILAYAFVFGQWRFVALTPILYGIVVMDGLKSSVRMLYLQQQLAELESELAEREPLFNWVTRYGIFGRGQRVELWDVDVNTVPQTAQYVLILSIYVGLIVASLVAWAPMEDATQVFGLEVDLVLLLVGYGTFSILFAAIVAVGYLHYERVGERIRELSGAPAMD